MHQDLISIFATVLLQGILSDQDLLSFETIMCNAKQTFKVPLNNCVDDPVLRFCVFRLFPLQIAPWLLLRAIVIVVKVQFVGQTSGRKTRKNLLANEEEASDILARSKTCYQQMPLLPSLQNAPWLLLHDWYRRIDYSGVLQCYSYDYSVRTFYAEHFSFLKILPLSPLLCPSTIHNIGNASRNAII